MKIEKRQKLLLLLCFAALSIALFYYLQFRKSTLFFELAGLGRNVGVYHTPDFLYALPTLVHVFAFSILTWVVSGLRYPLFSTLLWTGINLFFELLQLLPDDIAEMLPSLFKSYAIKGTFDLYDIGAIFIGALVGYALMKKV